ncbi:redox-active disulfide protein 2 [Flavobacterium sp.]|uniref:redox-active disulfide protein 2 n=1 Tax=Flavobacterium sp. TaxID=239 RepID=UPI00260EC415|nr:redox-active disulfide protein 2 [Flavobacterium sp.]
MNSKKPSEMSNEELLKTEKILKPITYLLAACILFLFIQNIYLSFSKGFSAFHIIPIALLPIAIINFKSLKEIKKEIEVRKL